jgi:hypothetical protein
MFNQRLQAGPVHLAAADGVIGVHLDQFPASRRGERRQFLLLLFQALFLPIGRTPDMADGLHRPRG